LALYTSLKGIGTPTPTAEIGYALFAYDAVHREGNLH